jgi:hypothetical protein
MLYAHAHIVHTCQQYWFGVTILFNIVDNCEQCGQKFTSMLQQSDRSFLTACDYDSKWTKKMNDTTTGRITCNGVQRHCNFLCLIKSNI